jgi:Domain of unknown function (DUF4168)
MRSKIWFLPAAVLIAVSHLSVTDANAQNVEQSEPGLSAPLPFDPSSAITDQKLDAAVAAIERVATLQKIYRGRLEAATASDRQSIAAEANAALSQAVVDQGLSMEEFESILQMAENDHEFLEKVRHRIRPQGEPE